MIQVERGHSITMSVTVLDGETTVAADEAPQVTITDWAGGTVGSPITSEEGVGGAYTAVFPGQSTLGLYSATWPFEVNSNPHQIVDQVDVVGGHYFQLPELRNRSGMENTTRYTTADLITARQWAETRIDNAIGVSFVERFAVCEIDLRPEWWRNESIIQLPDRNARTVIAVLVDGEPVDLEQLTLRPAGKLANTVLWSGYQVTVAYTTAWSLTAPSDISGAAITAARHWLLGNVGDSAIPDRTRQIITAEGTQILSVAGQYSPIGLPDVDVVLMEYWDRIRIPGIA